MNDYKAIILAAGKGVRMKSELPKVLHPLMGKSLILHVIDNIQKAGIKGINVIVGYKGEEVINAIGNSVVYTWQREQLGTGHAVKQAEDFFKGYKGKVIVASGDAPLVSSYSFERLKEEMEDSAVKASVLTMILESPSGYGRMVKDEQGLLKAIVEEKDATQEQKAIKEVNTGTYVFDSEILFQGLGALTNNNAQREYYLTDVISYIVGRGFKVTTVPVKDVFEGRGINSPEELLLLENEVKNRVTV